MTVAATLPGRAVRNGLAWKPYVYRGTGVDTLTPHIVSGPAGAPDYPDPAPDPPQFKRRRGRGICSTCGYGTRGVNHRLLCGGAP